MLMMILKLNLLRTFAITILTVNGHFLDLKTRHLLSKLSKIYYLKDLEGHQHRESLKVIL